MSKFSNLYDVDGNIINPSPQHTFTIEECEELVDKLTKKVEENPEDEVYKVYLNNAQKWLMHMYDGMSRQDLMKRMSFLTDSIQNAKNEATEAEKEQLNAVEKAMEELNYQKPVVVRIEGNKAEIAHETLKNAKIPVTIAENCSDAVIKTLNILKDGKA